MNLPEAATDSSRRLRTLKIKATSRNPDPVSRNLKLKLGHQKTSKDGEESSVKVRDTRLQRSRSTRNNPGLNEHSDPSFSTQRMLDNPVGKLSWLMLSKHEEGYRYIPQLGNAVVYLVQGHQEYSELALKSERSPWGPWSSMKERIRAVEICKVESLVYGTMPGSGESCSKIILKFVDTSSAMVKRSSYNCLKLILTTLLSRKAGMMLPLKEIGRQEKTARFGGEILMEAGSWWEGQIVQCQAKSREFPDSPRLRYENEEPHRHCPWELHDASMSWEAPHIDYESRDKLLRDFSKAERKDFEAIQLMNQVAERPDFCNSNPVQLVPELIKARLRNDYYRRLEAVKHDMLLMLENSRQYFKRNELQARIKNLSKWLKKKISRL